MADLSLELAEAKLKISDLVSDNVELNEKIRLLTSATGERCPKCNNLTFEIISTKPHEIFGDLGTKEREYKCSGCGFNESKLIEP